ncbi:aminoglycoside phosphotransferase family protein [Streptomyces sp. NPDC003720]|uniref:aminoglycoside phosphotransferase family protein n=1 Tax=Streptomyces sp. NPDC003720 TaxID=3364684 RepID=UPI003693BE0A
MGAPLVPAPSCGAGAGFTAESHHAVSAFVAEAEVRAEPSSGHHNRNFVVPVSSDVAPHLGRPAGTDVTVRIRRAEALPVVIRTWQNEAAILRAIEDVLPGVPRCLAEGDGFAVHSYVEGIPLAGVCGNGQRVESVLVRAMAGLFAEMTRVNDSSLPPLPPGWPARDDDSSGFLRALAQLADVQIRQPNWSLFGPLFTALGVPEDALARYAERVPAMDRRPFSLLHADLHRGNVIMSYGGDPPLIWVDWELATYGDPLHDLAVHLVRTGYPDDQWAEVIDTWADVMREFRPAAVTGLVRDLPHYIAFERAQSVYPDVMRAAEALAKTSDQKGLDEATTRIRRALRAAAGPLALARIPEPREIEAILHRWRASAGGGGRATSIVWQPDARVRQREDFPHSLVPDVLSLESAAPADWVFKGTTHTNSVVRIPGSGLPVVVRRASGRPLRYEPRFLSEHAVLQAIESADVRVMAPRLLALGRTRATDRTGVRASAEAGFAIHTYVAPPDMRGAPEHPVHGLLPHEADRLVDQLAALTSVDHARLDPAGDLPGYYGWLCEQLVILVENLPAEAQLLAGELRLPRSEQLRFLLERHRVSHRAPTLLHGDLNPWNLVRRHDESALAIIDWERAFIGDPLHDLVRHIHLTPTRPEIRDRMLRRWEVLLDPRYTWNWRQDWSVYRLIEIARSAYVDLAFMVERDAQDVPEVRRRLDSYAFTLRQAIAGLGLRARPVANPYLADALRYGDGGAGGTRPAGR